MKIKIILAGLAGIILAACTSDDTFTENTVIKQTGSLKVEVMDDCSANTRANYTGFPSTTFETGDAIGVYSFDGSSYVASNVRFVKQSDGSWLPDEEIPYSEDCTYYAYFPYRATTYTPSTSGTVDAVDTKFVSFISDASDYFWQADQSTKSGFTYSNLMIAKGTITDTSDNVTVKFSMKHKRGLAVLGGDAVDVTYSGNIPYNSGNDMYFLMKPQTATSIGGNSLSAIAGEYIEKTITIPGIDLSKVDNAGNARTTRTTANCYLVHAVGDYRIPLVYGNAIKNGAVNTIAFNPGTVTNGTDRFVNHNGDGITGPWITKSGSGTNAGMGLTAASAELLWQDATGLITSVSVNGNFLEFTVGTYAGGNALIAVKDDSGTILWSWHIWATTETLASTTAINTGSHTYNVTAVNLGWVPTGGSGKQGYCPYYQWGRKDPFIPCNGTTNGNTNKTVYNISGSTVTGLIHQASTTATIADNIKNPTCHYSNSSTYGPVMTTYNNMWDAQNTTTDIVATPTKKTIYDPCPPGFCVPTSNLWYYFAGNLYSDNGTSGRKDTNWDSTNKGKIWTLNGANLYFPATGVRNSETGNLTQIGTHVRIWASIPSSELRGYYIQITNSLWICSENRRASGFSVRPVVEE